MYDYAQLCITGDCIEIIAKYLDPIDIINVCNVYPKNWKRLNEILFSTIAIKIDSYFKSFFGPRYKDIKQRMILDEGVIFGSFILQIILNQTPENIDLCIPFSQQERTDFYSNLETFFFVDIETFDITYRHNVHMNKFNKNVIVNIRNYKIPKFDVDENQTFQIIKVDFNKIQTINEFIEKYFNIDVYKNTFFYDQNGYHVTIKNPKQINQNQKYLNNNKKKTNKMRKLK